MRPPVGQLLRLASQKIRLPVTLGVIEQDGIGSHVTAAPVVPGAMFVMLTCGFGQPGIGSHVTCCELTSIRGFLHSPGTHVTQLTGSYAVNASAGWAPNAVVPNRKAYAA